MMPDQTCEEHEFITKAVGLFSQQLWCWGRDILRREGNWLLENGFVRIPPPRNRKGCASVYVLRMPSSKCIVLRGFGVFYGVGERGGVFLRRYEFQPRFTTDSELKIPPWNADDLPPLDMPAHSERARCVQLTLELIDWIRKYELNVLERLGVNYRRSTLTDWDDGERSVVPAEEMARDWRMLGVMLAGNSQHLFEGCAGQE